MSIFNKEYISNILNESKNNNPKIIKKYFVKSDDGVDNCCVIVEGYDHPMRGRSAMIILDIRDDDNYILCKNGNDGDYNMPGGGWNKGETPKQAAIREGHEETLCEIKNVKPEGLLIEYRDSKSKVNQWVKEHVKDENLWWYGYYSAIFVGLYDGKYTGKVDERDKENGFKWKKVDEIIDKLPKEYQDAISDYLKSVS